MADLQPSGENNDIDISYPVKPLEDLLTEMVTNAEIRSPRGGEFSLDGNYDELNGIGALKALVNAVNEAKDTVYGNSKRVQTLTIEVHRREEDLVKEAEALRQSLMRKPKPRTPLYNPSAIAAQRADLISRGMMISGSPRPYSPSVRPTTSQSSRPGTSGGHGSRKKKDHDSTGALLDF